MTWMSLPESSYDYYVKVSGGSDSNDGKSWDNAFATCSAAASAVSSYGRVWLESGDHLFTSELSYQEKRIQWIGPPNPAKGSEALTGGATFTGTANSLSYFVQMTVNDISPYNIYGGGFHNIAFDAQAITSGGKAVVNKQVNYFRLEDCAIVGPTGGHKNVYMADASFLPTTGTVDKSWWTVKGCSAFNSGLITSTTSLGGMNGWYVENVVGESDSGATMPYLNLVEKYNGLHLVHGWFSNTNSSVSAVVVDQTSNVSQSASVHIVGVAGEDIGSPYYLVELINCDAFVAYGGPYQNSDGLIYGDSNTTGYMAVPSSGLTGSLTSGAN